MTDITLIPGCIGWCPEKVNSDGSNGAVVGPLHNGGTGLWSPTNPPYMWAGDGSASALNPYGPITAIAAPLHIDPPVGSRWKCVSGSNVGMVCFTSDGEIWWEPPFTKEFQPSPSNTELFIRLHDMQKETAMTAPPLIPEPILHPGCYALTESGEVVGPMRCVSDIFVSHGGEWFSNGDPRYNNAFGAITAIAAPLPKDPPAGSMWRCVQGANAGKMRTAGANGTYWLDQPCPSGYVAAPAPAPGPADLFIRLPGDRRWDQWLGWWMMTSIDGQVSKHYANELADTEQAVPPPSKPFEYIAKITRLEGEWDRQCEFNAKIIVKITALEAAIASIARLEIASLPEVVALVEKTMALRKAVQKMRISSFGVTNDVHEACMPLDIAIDKLAAIMKSGQPQEPGKKAKIREANRIDQRSGGNK